MPAYEPPAAPNAEIIQSTSERPVPNILQARRERDGSWTVKAITKDGVINQIVIPPSQALR